MEKENAVRAKVEFITKLTSCIMPEVVGWKVGKEDGLDNGCWEG